MGKKSKKKNGKKNGKRLNNNESKDNNKIRPKEVESSSSDEDSSKEKLFIVPELNTVIVGNLSKHVDETGLWLFFHKEGGIPAPEILDTRVDTFEEDGTCRGSGQVKFATDEAVQKACQLSGHELRGQAVSINFGHERRTISPDGSYMKPDYFSSNTVLIRGFDTAYDVKKMDLLLSEHFEACGYIEDTNMLIDSETKASIGVMFMQFEDQISVSNALRLNGTKFGGCPLHVEEAIP